MNEYHVFRRAEVDLWYVVEARNAESALKKVSKTASTQVQSISNIGERYPQRLPQFMQVLSFGGYNGDGWWHTYEDVPGQRRRARVPLKPEHQEGGRDD